MLKFYQPIRIRLIGRPLNRFLPCFPVDVVKKSSRAKSCVVNLGRVVVLNNSALITAYKTSSNFDYVKRGKTGLNKVLHFSRNKSVIKSEIDNELTLLHAFEQGKIGKIKMGNIIIDTYITKKPCIFIKSMCEAAKKVLTSPNAGGKSEISEMVSCEYFKRRFNATNFLGEMEVIYDVHNGKLSDYICKIYNFQVGVSVTRAMMQKDATVYNEEAAEELLKKKMSGLIIARTNTNKFHAYSVCFLHIWCKTLKVAQMIEKVYPKVVSSDESQTFREIIVLATVYKENFIYSNKL